MTTLDVDFSTITRIIYNGVDHDKFIHNTSSKWERVWTVSSETQQVNQGYWTTPAPYQEWVETSRTYGSTFRWNVNCNSAVVMWPDGQPTGSYEWVTVGCSPYWVGRNYTSNGYYRWVYPAAYWTDNWVDVTTDTSHYVYYY